MPDYSKGQIYKIVDNGFNKCYIGSTCEELSQRMARHRVKYNHWKQGKYHFLSSFNLFDEFGVENCKIIWIEDYPCNSKKELEAREGKHQKEHECVNQLIAGRSRKERYEDDRDKYLVKMKEDYEKHKDKRSEQRKEHRRNNLEFTREQDRQAYQRNKAVKTRPYTCECGLTICFSSRSNHFKTKKHQQYLQSLNQNNPMNE